MGREPDHGHAGDQAEPGGHERHAGGGQRPEREQQDDERRDDADRGCRAGAEALRLLDHLPAGGDLQTWHVDRVDGVEQRLAASTAPSRL